MSSQDVAWDGGPPGLEREVEEEDWQIARAATRDHSTDKYHYVKSDNRQTSSSDKNYDYRGRSRRESGQSYRYSDNRRSNRKYRKSRSTSPPRTSRRSRSTSRSRGKRVRSSDSSGEIKHISSSKSRRRKSSSSSSSSRSSSSSPLSRKSTGRDKRHSTYKKHDKEIETKKKTRCRSPSPPVSSQDMQTVQSTYDSDRNERNDCQSSSKTEEDESHQRESFKKTVQSSQRDNNIPTSFPLKNDINYYQQGVVVPPAPNAPPFKNDGSFLEMFKRMQEMQKSQESSSSAIQPAQATDIKKPNPPLIGKRRGGRVLKTGMVKKAKAIEEQTVDNNPTDAWSLYLQEVKKYRETSCEEEGKTRPLVK